MLTTLLVRKARRDCVYEAGSDIVLWCEIERKPCFANCFWKIARSSFVFYIGNQSVVAIWGLSTLNGRNFAANPSWASEHSKHVFGILKLRCYILLNVLFKIKKQVFELYGFIYLMCLLFLKSIAVGTLFSYLWKLMKFIFKKCVFLICFFLFFVGFSSIFRFFSDFHDFSKNPIQSDLKKQIKKTFLKNKCHQLPKLAK